MRKRLGITMLAMALTMMAIGRPALAVDVVDDPVQMDELAAKVVTTSNSLCWEIYRYHQQQPGYADTYRTAKEIWSRANQIREALAAGPVETEALKQRADELNQMVAQLEKSVSQWGPGDRSTLGAASGTQPKTVVQQGVGIDVPFVGIRLGGPTTVVVDEGLPLPRLRLHPNSHGTKRSLEREFAALKVAIGYLVEDASVSSPTNATSPTPVSQEPTPIPVPPTPGSTLESPTPLSSVPQKPESVPSPK